LRQVLGAAFVNKLNWKTDMQKQNKYAVVIEPTNTGYSVFVPDLPGCVTVAESREAALEMIVEAIELHIESL